jgi:hypothetical protein
MRTRPRPATARKPRAAVRKLAAIDIGSMPLKPPAPRERPRRHRLRFYERRRK